MSFFLGFFALGLLVSIPPGANTLVCLDLARGGLHRAAPIIASAAFVDALYSALAFAGILASAHAGARIATAFAPAFLFLGGALVWFGCLSSPTRVAAAALFNPVTAAIWLGFAPELERFASPAALLLGPLAVALGTASWFTLLAASASKLQRVLAPSALVWARRLFSLLLVLFAVLSLL